MLGWFCSWMFWRGLFLQKVNLSIPSLENHGVGGRLRNGQFTYWIGCTLGNFLYQDRPLVKTIINFVLSWPFGMLILYCRFGDLKLQNPENKAFAQMFQKSYAGKILECHLNLLNRIRVGGYLPDRVTNLILQYLSNRFANDILKCNFYFFSCSVDPPYIYP